MYLMTIKNKLGGVEDKKLNGKLNALEGRRYQLRKLTLIIVVNAVLILLFVITNYGIWNMVDIYPILGNTVMNPINVIVSMWGEVVDGEIYRVDGMGIMPNFPFWLFFISTVVNLYFILKLDKESKLNKQ